MMQSVFLDVGIGLIVVYLLLSLLCSAINEWIAGMLSLRSRMLAKRIKGLFDDKKGVALAKTFYDHGLIESLSKKGQIEEKPLNGRKGPSYIPASAFSKVLMDVLDLNHGQVHVQLNNIKEDKRVSQKLGETLSTLIKDADGNASILQKNIEAWFDDVMARVGGWYKRQAQIILLVIASFVTIVMNIDSVDVAMKLYREPLLRSALVEKASKIPDNQLDEKNVNVVLGKLDSLGLRFGWPDSKSIMVNVTPNSNAGTGAEGNRDNEKRLSKYILSRLFGWILTIAAISMGGPFWFDLLKKFLQVRSTGSLPAEKEKMLKKKPAQ